MFKFSTTTNFVGKPIIDNANKTIESPLGIKKLSALAYNFCNQDVSFEEMFDWLTVDGYPYVPCLINTHKHSNNFEANYVAMVDIDHGMTIADLLDDRLYKEYGSGYYTTANHKENEPRFRILFRLEEPITDKDKMVLLNKALIRYYGTTVADNACNDACRMFFGSINAQFKEITDRYLPTNKIALLIKKQKIFNQKHKKQKQHSQHLGCRNTAILVIF